MGLADYISISVGFTYIIPLIIYIPTGDPTHIKGFIGVGLTAIISESLKPFFAKCSPRPFAANNCNLLCNDGHQGGRPGMPSSHSATVVFLTGYYLKYTNNTLLNMLFIEYAFAVMASRYVKRCHTIPQIISGALLGLSLSYGLIS